MPIDVKIPALGESISSGVLSSWKVTEGTYVEIDQPIYELETDKVTQEGLAEVAGVISFLAQEGDEVEIGATIAKIDESAEKPASSSSESKVEETDPPVETAVSPDPPTESAPSPSPAPTVANVKSQEAIDSTPSSIPLSPAVRKILTETNLDPSTISGTGKDGRITKEDAVKAVPSMGTAPTHGERGSERKKLSMLRRKVAQRLVAVKNETAMLTTFNEVNMQPIFDLRKEFKEDFKAKHNVGLGFMSFFTLAIVRALKLFPDVNSMMDGDYKITPDFQDISIAVSGPKGLMVPVIRNAENLSFRGVESEVKRLAIRARDGQITVDEMTGGTFTITNGGVFGSMLSTPIINPPQSGILGMHNIVNRPMAVNGEVVIQPIMYVALSYDHRIIDGKESVSFLVAVKEALENPIELLMDNNALKSLEL